ncbi:MAG: hypothetical protein HLUCCA08_01350 [Rhodobacteraceae bacterium HLUCCA08]|nr:MAG: hypothetical protein HLUCCA08_01350 [Rhodobacteraceae bacterium HLUCCA08]
MTAHDPDLRPARGAAAVGQLAELGPVEAGAVLCLRLWSDGPDDRAALQADLRQHLGASVGALACAAMETIGALCTRFGRRPLMRHDVDCACLGGDEAAFALLVATAAEGETEDALMLAALIVRADVAPMLIAPARDLGLSLRRMSLTIQAHPAAAMMH